MEFARTSQSLHSLCKQKDAICEWREEYCPKHPTPVPYIMGPCTCNTFCEGSALSQLSAAVVLWVGLLPKASPPPGPSLFLVGLPPLHTRACTCHSSAGAFSPCTDHLGPPCMFVADDLNLLRFQPFKMAFFFLPCPALWTKLCSKLHWSWNPLNLTMWLYLEIRLS